jgi:hypothetical protein
VVSDDPTGEAEISPASTSVDSEPKLELLDDRDSVSCPFFVSSPALLVVSVVTDFALVALDSVTEGPETVSVELVAGLDDGGGEEVTELFSSVEEQVLSTSIVTVDADVFSGLGFDMIDQAENYKHCIYCVTVCG